MSRFLLIGLIAIAMTATGAQAITLEWDASAGTVDAYRVEISADGGTTWPYWYTVPGDQTSLWLDDKLQFNATYHFRVSASNSAGESLPCTPISWARPPYAPPPDSPMPAVNQGTPPEPPEGAVVQ